MGDHRQIDRIRAERLLDGTDLGTDSVGRLLAAARGPVRPDELRREAEAIGAFRVGATPATPRRLVTAPHRIAPHRMAPHRRAWTKLVGVKVAALAFAVTLAGVALAAGTGVLPNPLDGPPAPTSAGPPTLPGSPLSSDPTRRSSSSPTSAAEPSSPGASTSPGAAANHASLVGLCRAYQARGDRDPGAAMGSAAFAGLVAAAGGTDRVEAFCADLLAAEPAPGNGTGGTTPTAGPSPTAGQSNGQSSGQSNGQSSSQTSGQASSPSDGQGSGREQSTRLGTGATAETAGELSGA